MTTYDAALTAVLEREPEPAGGTISRDVDYEVDGVGCAGYLAAPAGVDESAAVPGVLVLHDWLGVGDNVRMRADMLARLGYVALAADIYGADTRPTQQQAPEVAGRFYGDKTLFRTRVAAGLAQLAEQPGVDASRLAVIGYCFGGSGALELARSGADVRGVVSFHGALHTGPAEEAAGIRAAVLVEHGAIDPVVPDAALTQFMDYLRQAPGLDWMVRVHANAMHAFTLPDADAPDHGAQFNPVAERRSWSDLKAFLSEIFG